MAVGLPQVTAADHENSDFSPSDRPARLPRGRDRRVLQRVVDPPHDHLFCPYVAYICSPGLGHMIGHAIGRRRVIHDIHPYEGVFPR